MICWPEGSMEFVSRAAAEGSGGDRRWPCKVRVKSCSRYMAELIIHCLLYTSDAADDR